MVILVVDDVSLMRKTIVDVLLNHCGMDRTSIYETTDGERVIVQDCIKTGTKDYIVKPLDPERVKVTIGKCRQGAKI